MTKKTKELLSQWALPDRTDDRAQVTLRLDFDTYAKLHALKNVFPHRSVNEFINDLLDDGVNEIIDALGEPSAGGYQYVEEVGEEIHFDSNNAYRFSSFYSIIMNEGKGCSLLGIIKKQEETEEAE